MLSRDPTASSWSREIWESRVMVAPVWMRMGKGLMLMLSSVAGSGLPSITQGYQHLGLYVEFSPQKPYSTSVGGADTTSVLEETQAKKVKERRLKNLIMLKCVN